MTNLTLPFAQDLQIRGSGEILKDVRALLKMHADGRLGSSTMPEDVHPRIDASGADLAHYFTLTMALNYQRNSYALWRAATSAYNDPDTSIIFQPNEVIKIAPEQLSDLLLKHRVALQPVKHADTWRRLCRTLCNLYRGDIRELFVTCNNDIADILREVRETRRREFPYLSGPKIANYWLYVMSTYTDLHLFNRGALSVAPDTHVIQASGRLGLITGNETASAHVAELVAKRWKETLEDTEIAQIDIHTPLWLWSRGGFQQIVV